MSGLCNQAAAEEPSAMGVALPAAQAASRAAESESGWWIVLTWRAEYVNVV